MVKINKKNKKKAVKKAVKKEESKEEKLLNDVMKYINSSEGDEKKSKVVIYASIMVERKSQKPIVIGKNGASIKKIGSMARLGIEEFLGREVYLDLHVKVRTDWRKKDSHLREIGLLRR